MITFVPTVFILIQTDLSSSVVMIVILIMMLASSGIGHKILAPVAAVAFPAVGALFWYILQPNQKLLRGYQLARITGWLHPEKRESWRYVPAEQLGSFHCIRKIVWETFGW